MPNITTLAARVTLIFSIAACEAATNAPSTQSVTLADCGKELMETYQRYRSAITAAPRTIDSYDHAIEYIDLTNIRSQSSSILDEKRKEAGGQKKTLEGKYASLDSYMRFYVDATFLAQENQILSIDAYAGNCSQEAEGRLKLKLRHSELKPLEPDMEFTRRTINFIQVDGHWKIINSSLEPRAVENDFDADTTYQIVK